MLEILIDVINLPIRAYNYFVKIWNKWVVGQFESVFFFSSHFSTIFTTSSNVHK